MSFFSLFYQEFVVRPIFNGLIFFYNLLPYPDFGLAIVLLVVGVRVLLYPLNNAQLKFQHQQAKIQPRVQEIQKKYKDDRAQQTKELLDLYKKEGVNPFFGILALLILVVQILFIIGLYSVFSKGFSIDRFSMLYSFVGAPNNFNTSFLKLIDLSRSNIFIAVLAGFSQFLQAKLFLPAPGATQSKDSFMAIFQKQSVYVFPILTVVIALRFPAALPLSWTVMNIFAILQQEIVKRRSHEGFNGKNKESPQGSSVQNGLSGRSGSI